MDYVFSPIDKDYLFKLDSSFQTPVCSLVTSGPKVHSHVTSTKGSY